MKTLTPNSIKRLEVRAARYDQADDKITGLAIAVFPSGVKSWNVRYTVKGKVWRQTLGKWPTINIQTARRLATEALREVAAGKNPQKEKIEHRQRRALGLDREDTFATVWEDYIKRHVNRNLKPSTGREIRRIGTKLVIPRIGKRQLKEITAREIKVLLDRIHEHAPVGANRVLAVLTAFWNWTIAELINSENPCEGLKKPTPKETKRSRVLSDLELKHLWQAAFEIGWPFGDLVRVLILTGVRRGEAAGIHFDEIDDAAAQWLIPGARTKNGRDHVVHVSKELAAVIGPLKRGKGFLFSEGKNPPSGFSRAKRRLDAKLAKIRAENFEVMTEWTFHDIRRSVASGMARLKIDPTVIDLVLNHRSGDLGGLREVYIHHNELELTKDALEKWSAHAAKVIIERRTRVVSG